MVAPPAFPIDKYLNLEYPADDVLNIFGDDWSFQPAMKPEDEMMLKRLHDMLRAVAEDFRELSNEIIRSKQPTVQVKTRPTPLDEEFNERVHIKELVDAKFNGRILVDRIQKKPQPNVLTLSESTNEKKIDAGVQVNLTVNKSESNMNNTKPLPISTKTPIRELKTIKADDYNDHLTPSGPSKIYISYEELKSDKAPSIQITPSKNCVIQEMPSVQIRSELKEQRVVSLDISPNAITNKPTHSIINSAVIEIDHDANAPVNPIINQDLKSESSIRKIVKLPSYESSDTVSNSEGEKHKKEKVTANTPPHNTGSRTCQRKIRITIPNNDSVKNKMKKSGISHRPSDEWKKKLNTVYGKPSTSRTQSTLRQSKTQNSAKKTKPDTFVKNNNILNNAEYVPYSKLTLGGVNVSDIENEIANVTDKANLPLSPILDKILSSQDSSFQESPRTENKVTSKPYTKSDQKLLKEVLDMDRRIKKTLNKDAQNISPVSDTSKTIKNNEDEDGNSSYADDFDEDVDKSLQASAGISSQKVQNTDVPNNRIVKTSDDTEVEVNMSSESITSQSASGGKESVNDNKTTQRKSSALSFKNAVDVFEFVHSVDTQDIAIQSHPTQKISLKETQTSPRSEANIQPIHNELWEPSPFDTSDEINTLFKLEKDFIKNFIIEEYGDIFEITKNIAKPTTSKSDVDTKGKNVASHPKITQTSPSHVKNVMTSPMRINATSTSSFNKRLDVHRQASPLVISNIENSAARTAESDMEDTGIAINLSSPRFNLRLPQSSRDVLSNLESASSVNPKAKVNAKKNTGKNSKERKASSSESWNEGTDTDVSSLGEVNWKLKRARARRERARKFTMSESSSTSAVQSSADGVSENLVPIKSEGEVSLGQL